MPAATDAGLYHSSAEAPAMGHVHLEVGGLDDARRFYTYLPATQSL